MQTQQHRSYIKYILGIALIAGMGIAGWWFLAQPKEGIYPYKAAADRAFILDFFKDKDNWYWLMHDYIKEKDYSIEDLVDRRILHSEPEYSGKVLINVYRIQNKPVGFSVFYPKELLEGNILFIAVDKDYRKQGIARKLTLNAIDELQKRGSQVIRLWTRAENVRARKLYESLGFKQFWTDGGYVRLEKYLTKPS